MYICMYICKSDHSPSGDDFMVFHWKCLFFFCTKPQYVGFYFFKIKEIKKLKANTPPPNHYPPPHARHQLARLVRSAFNFLFLFVHFLISKKFLAF